MSGETGFAVANIMLTVHEAQQRILEEVRARNQRCLLNLPLPDAHGHWLAHDIIATLNSPPFDKSAMDGYAIRCEDASTSGITLRVVEEITAGRVPTKVVGAGEATRIMTGAPVPEGADVVIPFELTTAVGDACITINTPLAAGANIIPRGEMYHAGDVLLRAGSRIRHPEIALLAEIGCGVVSTWGSPSVAVLATGDELVPATETPGPGQIRNSNEPMLQTQVDRFGCTTTGLGIARDQREELLTKINAGLGHDILLLTGGVSMGTRDLVPAILSELGVIECFHKVQLKPGKPVWFGVWDSPTNHRCLIFALPGNPVSSMVCCELFVRPAVRKLQGAAEAFAPKRLLPLARDFSFKDQRPTCYPARLEWTDNGPQVTPTNWRGSADLLSPTQANGMIWFPAGERNYIAGDQIEFQSWGED